MVLALDGLKRKRLADESNFPAIRMGFGFAVFLSGWTVENWDWVFRYRAAASAITSLALVLERRGIRGLKLKQYFPKKFVAGGKLSVTLCAPFPFEGEG